LIQQEPALRVTGYRVDVTGTWKGTISSLEGVFSGESLLTLPGKPYIAVRISKQ